MGTPGYPPDSSHGPLSGPGQPHQPTQPAPTPAESPEEEPTEE